MSHTSSTTLPEHLQAEPPGPQAVARKAMLPEQGFELITPAHAADRSNAGRKYFALELWHLLSLDAPSIAVLWTLLLAQCTGVSLPWRLPAALFLAVWILYAGDRLLDTRSDSLAGSERELLERHLFHARYRNAFLTGIVSCGALLFLLLLQSKDLIALYAAPGALLVGWLALVHGRQEPAVGRKPLPKELAVAVFFPAAVFGPSFFPIHAGPAPTGLRWELVPFAVLFAAVCGLNCFFLYAWEHGHREAHRAHASTRWGIQNLEPLAFGTLAAALLASLALVLPVASIRSSAALSRFGLACALATVLLLLLHRHQHRLQPLAVRVAADAALLTPVLFLRFHG